MPHLAAPRARPGGHAAAGRYCLGMNELTRTTITAHDGHTFEALVAMPAAGHGPGVILIQEIFGLNEFVQEMARRLAAEGYVVYAPDLFARIRPGIELGYSPEEWQEAFGLFQQFDLDNGVRDIDATMAAMRVNDAAHGDRVGCIGFCLGGKLALLCATRTSVDAAVSYYGVALDEHLDELGNIKAPTLLHFAGEDDYFDTDAQLRFKEAAAANPNITIYDYPGRHHAFARPQGDHFDKDAADAAWRRTLETLETLRLQPPGSQG